MLSACASGYASERNIDLPAWLCQPHAHDRPQVSQHHVCVLASSPPCVFQRHTVNGVAFLVLPTTLIVTSATPTACFFVSLLLSRLVAALHCLL